MLAGREVSRTQRGLLVGFMFGATGLGSIPAGRVVGLLGARWSVVIEMALVAVALLVPVLWPGYPALLACALLSASGTRSPTSRRASPWRPRCLHSATVWGTR